MEVESACQPNRYIFQLLYNSQAGIWKCDVVTAISQMIYLSGNKMLILLSL